MKRRFISFLIMVWFLAFSAGCSPATTPPPTPTALTVASETPRPSEPSAPSSTPTPPPQPSQTPTATTRPSDTATATATSTPRPTFAGFAVEYIQPGPYGLLFGIKIPGVKETYRLTVNETEYKCELSEKAPDHLLCYGPRVFNQGQTVKMVFWPISGGDTPVYETSYKVAMIGTPTLNPTALIEAAKACKIRGVGVTCETEYRNNGNTYCIVSTCADLCGYYYSVDTCPPGSEKGGIYPMTGTPPLPPNR